MEPSFITERCEFRVKNTSLTARKIQSQKCVLLSWSTCVCSIVATESTNMFHFENGPRGHCAWWKRKGKNTYYLCRHRQGVTRRLPFLGGHRTNEPRKTCMKYAAFPAPREHWRGTEMECVKRNLFNDCAADNDWYRSSGPASRRHRINPLQPSGNYMYHLFHQSVIVRSVFMGLSWVSM
jgi:hypothetical protein